MATRDVNTRARRGRAWEAANALMNQVAKRGSMSMSQEEKVEYDLKIAEINDCDKELAEFDQMVATARAGVTIGQNSSSRYSKAEGQQLFADLQPALRPGGRASDVRQGTILTTSEGEFLIPSEVIPLVLDATAAYDVFAQLGGRDYPRSTIQPLTQPILTGAVSVSTVAETVDPGSAVPSFTDVTMGGAKRLAYTSLTWESIASFLAQPGNSAYGNSALSNAVIAALSTGMLKSENAAFISLLAADTEANPHASFFNPGNGLISLFSECLATLPLQFRANSKFLFGKGAGQQTVMEATDSLGRQLFPDFPNTLMGRPVVLSADIADTSFYLGDWSFGVYRSQSPLMLRILSEVLATAGQVAYLAARFSDWKTFAAAAPTVTEQPILRSNLDSASS